MQGDTIDHSMIRSIYIGRCKATNAFPEILFVVNQEVPKAVPVIGVHISGNQHVSKNQPANSPVSVTTTPKVFILKKRLMGAYKGSVGPLTCTSCYSSNSAELSPDTT